MTAPCRMKDNKLCASNGLLMWGWLDETAENGTGEESLSIGTWLRQGVRNGRGALSVERDVEGGHEKQDKTW